MKFTDNGKSLWAMGEQTIIQCPNCSKPIKTDYKKIACSQCGYSKAITDQQEYLQQDFQNYLEIDCCGEKLWALNLEHLDFLENYVQAKHRARIPNINRSLASRLPQWIKSKKNREAILKCIAKLRLRLKKNNYSTTRSITKG